MRLDITLCTGLVAALASVGSVTPAPAQEPGTITVTARGSAEWEPDMATLPVGVVTTGETAEEAARLNAERTDRVIQAVIRAGVDEKDIRTQGYHLSPEYRRESTGGEPDIVAYRAWNVVRIEVLELDAAGALIDRVLEAGANDIHGLTFGLKDPTAARADAVRDAVARARAEAEVMADALGTRLVRLRSATNHVGSEPVMRASAGDLEMREMAAVTPVQPGTLTVTANVTLVYTIDPGVR